MLQVGLDISYGQTKLAWSNGLGQPLAEVHPSGAAPIDQCDRVGAMPSSEGSLGYGADVFVGGVRYGVLIDPDPIATGMPPSALELSLVHL